MVNPYFDSDFRVYWRSQNHLSLEMWRGHNVFLVINYLRKTSLSHLQNLDLGLPSAKLSAHSLTDSTPSTLSLCFLVSLLDFFLWVYWPEKRASWASVLALSGCIFLFPFVDFATSFAGGSLGSFSSSVLSLGTIFRPHSPFPFNRISHSSFSI